MMSSSSPLKRWLFFAVASALVVSSAEAQSTTTSGQSLFLKEILMGRCYERFANVNQCPQVVGSVMSILDSQSDANINALSSFSGYIGQVDFSSPQNQALIWLTGSDGSFAGNTYQQGSSNVGDYGGYHKPSSSSDFALHRSMAPIELITPEITPGGFLMKDLIFCGIDRKNDGTCTRGSSNAYSSFWEAAYAQFARTVAGRVQIVIEPYADLEFLRRAVIQQLNAYSVNEVILYVDDCQDKAYANLVNSFPISSVQCKDNFSDYAFFLLCQNPNSDACSMLGSVDTTGNIATQQQAAIEQQEEDELELEKDANKNNGHFFIRFILFGIGCTLVYRYLQKPSNPPQYYEYSNVPPAETTSMRI